MSIRFTITPVAEGVPFDNEDNDFEATDVQNAIEEIDLTHEGLIAIRCIAGTNCIKDVDLLVDSTVCFLKQEEC